jgi:hypothetical protein
MRMHLIAVRIGFAEAVLKRPVTRLLGQTLSRFAGPGLEQRFQFALRVGLGVGGDAQHAVFAGQPAQRFRPRDNRLMRPTDLDLAINKFRLLLVVSLAKAGNNSATIEGQKISGWAMPRARAAVWRSMMARLQATENSSRAHGRRRAGRIPETDSARGFGVAGRRADLHQRAVNIKDDCADFHVSVAHKSG